MSFPHTFDPSSLLSLLYSYPSTIQYKISSIASSNTLPIILNPLILSPSLSPTVTTLMSASSISLSKLMVSTVPFALVMLGCPYFLPDIIKSACSMFLHAIFLSSIVIVILVFSIHSLTPLIPFILVFLFIILARTSVCPPSIFNIIVLFSVHICLPVLSPSFLTLSISSIRCRSSLKMALSSRTSLASSSLLVAILIYINSILSIILIPSVLAVINLVAVDPTITSISSLSSSFISPILLLP